MQWYQVCDCISDIDKMRSIFHPPEEHLTEYSGWLTTTAVVLMVGIAVLVAVVSAAPLLILHT